MNNSSYIRFAWATLVVLFLVIIAGSVVRMTGSGMGCPDWPKCFGYLIPPTDAEQVKFQPNHTYQKDQMIIHNNDLVSATKDFTSGANFNNNNWTVYEKHDYAKFNTAHTWTEYINRLLGAISGLFVLVLFVWTLLKVLKKHLHWSLLPLTFLTVLLLGFQAWLGKTVVDSNLATAKITAHMVGALALVFFMLLIIRKSSSFKLSISNNSKLIVAVCLALLLIQIYLGTEFRVLVDEAETSITAYEALFGSSAFKIHRSFAWLVLLSTLYAIWKIRKEVGFILPLKLLVLALIAEIGIGILMELLHFPFLSQPAHLLLACCLFAIYTWLLLVKTHAFNKAI